MLLWVEDGLGEVGGWGGGSFSESRAEVSCSPDRYRLGGVGLGFCSDLQDLQFGLRIYCCT